MKKNYLNPYEAPALEIIEVKIEQGFAASTPGEGLIEKPGLGNGGNDYDW